MITYQWRDAKEGRFELLADGVPMLTGFAKAAHVDGRTINSRQAEQLSASEADGGLRLVWQAANGLVLTEELTLADGVPMAVAVLSDADGSEVETRYLVPMVAMNDLPSEQTLWTSLWTRMLYVPYDNDMWLRYEALPWRAGQKSYDLTVLFNKTTREGLLIGALDFETWKNALLCSGYDARQIEAVCGVADEGTHDTMPHGTLKGERVRSSRFCVLYGDDYRRLLEDYGDLVNRLTKPLAWSGSPFGFNSWAGLAWELKEENFRFTGKFLREKLRPKGFENDGVSYVNLDACWQGMEEDALRSLREEQRAGGQKVGIYDGPFAFFGKDLDTPLPGVPDHTFREILLRDDRGEPLPRVDGSIPLDVTHPLWREYTRWKYEKFVAWGYDYVKIDFLSHAGMEGVHYDKTVRTGREALTLGYRYVAEQVSEARIGRPFFISLSIAPLFPNGYGHARRFSCDAFGTDEDVEYVLNAQTYSWWVNRRVYAYNDPDHIVLWRSFGMKRSSTEGEARARYTAAVIAGGVMMLSDDYQGKPESMARTELLATNREVNHVAAAETAFRPVECGEAYASHAFTAEIDGKPHLALFAFKAGERVRVDCRDAGLPEGTYRDLWSGKRYASAEGAITWAAAACDALLLVYEG